jgi:hypothetical protein
MVLVCPKCHSKVVTVTGYPLNVVPCGNCGAEISVPESPGRQSASVPPLAQSPKRTWWRRLFGSGRRT